MTDYWVVGKKSDQRELYVILNQKNANLIEVNGTSPLFGIKQMYVILTKSTPSVPVISSSPYVDPCLFFFPFSFFFITLEEVKRLCATQFNNIFFLD